MTRPSVKDSNTSPDSTTQNTGSFQAVPASIAAARANAGSIKPKNTFGSRTHVGLVRDHNEDSLIVTPPLFAVADGMGGHEAGEVASEITVSTLAELAPSHPDTDQFIQAVEAANLNVIQAPYEGVGREGMGTTLTAALLENERLIIAQVGDSRAYLLHQGRLQRVTRDHSLMADMIESGQITEEEAKWHPNRSVITRAIGSDPYMQPDIYELNVASGDRLLLCSDGLNSMIDDREIENTLSHIQDPQACADRLIDQALRAGGLDNVTAIVVDVEGSKPAAERKLQKKSRRFFTMIAIVLVAILGLAAFGAYSYVNNSAYLIEENGTISVYRGVNDQLLGVSLSSLDHATDIRVDDLPNAGVAERIKEGMPVSSLDEANRLISQYQEDIENKNQMQTINEQDSTENQKSSTKTTSATSKSSSSTSSTTTKKQGGEA